MGSGRWFSLPTAHYLLPTPKAARSLPNRKGEVPKYLVGEQTSMGTIPRRMGKIFRDREELSSSHNLGTELTQALEDSACQIVICSPNAANSHWTNEEILTYKRLGRENRIFCLIVDGEPGTDSECFPPAVRFQVGAAAGFPGLTGEFTDECGSSRMRVRGGSYFGS